MYQPESKLTLYYVPTALIFECIFITVDTIDPDS